ncbi:MAG: MBL fold metallo-hydrolase [Candidatus Nanoarchaeia archaeon]
MNIHIEKINKYITFVKEVFYEEHCNCYIVEDNDEVIIIDFGIGGIDFSKIINKYYKKKIMPILTHYHFDHFLGSTQFREIYSGTVSPIDFGLKYLNYKDFNSNSFNILDLDSLSISKIEELYRDISKKYLKEGDKLYTKNLEFYVIDTPGHDSTSISLYEKNKQWLFCGDIIYNGELLYDLKDSNLEDYMTSLYKLKNLNIKHLYAGHNDIIEGRDIDKLIDNKIVSLSKLD